jgi:hypothetical protein
MDRSIADLSAFVLAEIPPSGGGAPGIFNIVINYFENQIEQLNIEPLGPASS